jgi:hypothetical protein
MAGDQIHGEGNYDASRAFQKHERAFVKSGKVDEKAREAKEALDGPEGADLEKARRDTAKGRL